MNKIYKTPEQIKELNQYLSGERFEKMPIKTPEEIEKLKVAGGICARILDRVSAHVKPGVTTKELDALVHDLIVNTFNAEVDRLSTDGHTPAHHISGCFGLNDVVANLEPDDIPLKTGDLLGLDVSIRKDGWCGDTRKSWIVGDEASPIARSLFAVSHQAMWLAIGLVKPGVKFETIANAVETYANRHGFKMLKLSLTSGHSIGHAHLDGWMMPLYNTPLHKGRVLKEGMTFTIETFMSAGTGECGLLDNENGTCVTTDGSLACYWEHALAVTETGCDILDLRADESALWAKQAVQAFQSS